MSSTAVAPSQIAASPLSPPAVGGSAAAQRLRSFLSAYWLRPENALWMTLRSLALEECSIQGPVLDVCCGDGLFTFLHCGGALAPEFDVFTSVSNLDQVRANHADMFDHAAATYAPPITRPAQRQIDTGVDLKPALLAKAARLNLYTDLIEHDSNAPLPFLDGAFHTTYCNAAYWVREIDCLLDELARVTDPRGSVVLHVKLAEMKHWTLAGYREHLGDGLLDLIGRGRFETWPSMCDRLEWERRFQKAGLSVVSATPVATRTHAFLWDIGLRPLAPLLVRMANELTPQTRGQIKREWVDLLHDALTPLCRRDLDLCSGPPQFAELQYVLEPH